MGKKLTEHLCNCQRCGNLLEFDESDRGFTCAACNREYEIEVVDGAVNVKPSTNA